MLILLVPGELISIIIIFFVMHIYKGSIFSWLITRYFYYQWKVHCTHMLILSIQTFIGSGWIVLSKGIYATDI